MGASKAYHESQSRIYKLEAPLFVGVGDNMDFFADLSALKVIEPEEVTRARPDNSKPVPRSESVLLQKLKQGEVPYAHCAWCEEALQTRSMLEQHYFSIHHVVLQPSCCAPPSVFQTIMGKELQLRQRNFSGFSSQQVFLRESMRHEHASYLIKRACPLLMRSSNQLLRSLGGLLKGASDCKLTREPIPAWNPVKIVRTNCDADRVRQAIAFLCSDGNISINLPSAPMPMPERDTVRLMHPALVTHLAESKPYYMKGGLIPHLTKKGYFWKSSPPAIHMAVLKYRLYIDPVQSAHLNSVEQIDCGWTAPLPKMSHYDSATGLHHSISALSAQYWTKQDGTTAKAASLAVPPLLGSSSVQRLTQHFEHMSLRNASNSLDYGSASQIQLNHDEVSWEYYSGQVFPTLELVQSVERHHGAELQIRALGSQFNWTLNQEVVFSAALTGKPKKKLYFSQYCWKRCAIGTRLDYATALSRQEWQHALYHGDLPSLQQEDSRDPLIFSPYNNTEFLNVAAYMEAFWSYIWPTDPTTLSK